jgi:hypothetical protein
MMWLHQPRSEEKVWLLLDSSRLKFGNYFCKMIATCWRCINFSGQTKNDKFGYYTPFFWCHVAISPYL